MAQQVQAPQRQPRVGGIKSVLPGGAFVPDARLSAVMAAGGLVWEDAGCGLPISTRAGCYDEVTAPADKYGDGPEQYTTIGDPFALYKGVQCYIGGDEDGGGTYEDQARAVLEAGEDRGIEYRLFEWVREFTTSASPTLPEAIGVAEDLADNNYVGRPVLIMTRAYADEATAAGLLEWADGMLVTKANRTPVIATGAALGYAGIGILGQPAVYASNVVAWIGMNRAENVTMAIAERLYAIGVDCDFRRYISIEPTP
jgi:hypothetical protein